MSDYDEAKALGLTDKNRWEDGIEHHEMSERIARFLSEHDFYDYGDYFCWKLGGDGDNGEALMFQLDAFFELLDTKTPVDRVNACLAACEGELFPERGEMSRLRAENQELAEALEGVLDLFCRPDEDPLTAFERKAKAFEAHTGLMAPGKDDRSGIESTRERTDAWLAWHDGRFAAARAAIARAKGGEG